MLLDGLVTRSAAQIGRPKKALRRHIVVWMSFRIDESNGREGGASMNVEIAVGHAHSALLAWIRNNDEEEC